MTRAILCKQTIHSELSAHAALLYLYCCHVGAWPVGTLSIYPPTSSLVFVSHVQFAYPVRWSCLSPCAVKLVVWLNRNNHDLITPRADRYTFLRGRARRTLKLSGRVKPLLAGNGESPWARAPDGVLGFMHAAPCSLQRRVAVRAGSVLACAASQRLGSRRKHGTQPSDGGAWG